MPSGEKKGGDFVLEGRHLAGLFLLLVVIFGVVFTLGYLLGRSQYDTKLRTAFSKPADALALGTAPAAAPAEKPADRAVSPAGSNPDWDLRQPAEPKAVASHLPPGPPAPVARPAASTHPVNPPASSKTASTQDAPSAFHAPRIPKGAITLQVAAVLHETDALALAQALQGKKFPAFVLDPGVDKYYRVQVGPYPNTQSAGSARHELEAQGFKSITKR